MFGAAEFHWEKFDVRWRCTILRSMILKKIAYRNIIGIIAIEFAGLSSVIEVMSFLWINDQKCFVKRRYIKIQK